MFTSRSAIYASSVYIGGSVRYFSRRKSYLILDGPARPKARLVCVYWMITMIRFVRLAVIAAFLSSLIAHGQVLTTAEAKNHVGENATVCGTIASQTTATGSHGTPTFINLDQPYPHQVFTVLIWGSDKAAVGTIPETGRVCAKGPITLYRGVPEIIVHKSADLYVPSKKG
jgi:hypothetical protein